jgi:RNA polymerase sigma factor (sigma-70 family)
MTGGATKNPRGREVILQKVHLLYIEGRVKVTTHDLKAFIERCAKGDPEAQTEFQERYGPLIYTFPIRIYHTSEEEAGDFYLYVFEQARIFRRVRSFEGRNEIQFETYLSYYVLRDLFLEWTRAAERVETVSLDAPVKGSEAAGERTMTVQDILATDDPTPDAVLAESDAAREVEKILHQLDAEKRLILKLLALGIIELEPDDIRMIGQMASRSIGETLEVIEEVTAGLAVKEVKAEERLEALHTVAYRIHTYQRRIAELDEKIHPGRLHGDAEGMQALEQEKAELERKLVWRYQQQQKLREELQKADLRPSYKDIARILNARLGTVCSKIARAREEFGQRLAVARAEGA